MARKKSGYRLGRRLRASAKARRDYITYLQSGGDPSFRRVPEIPGRVSARFGLGGELGATIRTGSYIAGAFELGGAFRVNIYPPHIISASFGLGGTLVADVNSAVYMRPNFALGGELTGDLLAYTRQELSADFANGGLLIGSILQHQLLGVDFSGGGAYRGNIYPPVTVRASFTLGGELTGSAVIERRLSAAFAGGGTLIANVNNDVIIDADAQTIIDEMSPAPSTARQATISDLVTDLKNAGVWSKLRAMFVFAAHADAPARVNWKNPTALEAAKNGTLTFNVDVGFTASASSGIDTGYPLSGMVNTSIGMTFKFDQAGLPAASIGVGSEHADTYLRWLLNPGNPSNLQFVCSIMSDTAVFLAAGPGDLSRNFTIDRNGTTVAIYADGVSVHSETNAINKGTIPSARTPFSNAVNRTSTIEFSATDRNQQFMIIHDHLTGTEIAALHTACDNYLANL